MNEPNELKTSFPTDKNDSSIRVLITGANGFIGNSLCKKLVSENYNVVAALRNENTFFRYKDIPRIIVGQINGHTEWDDAVKKADIVVHLAARVHVMSKEKPHLAIQTYRKVNVEGTEKLARDAARAGVRRFVYISSIKVNGEENSIGYRECDEPSPTDGYGISKMETEEKLQKVATETNMEIVIIRPPLVYGPGVKANFLALMRLIDLTVPLPLKRVSNCRSLIYLENLVDAICCCMIHPTAAGQTYLVSDGRDLSTPELIRLIAASMNKRAYLFSVPDRLLHIAGGLIGRSGAVSRMIGSLTVDIAKIKKELSWTPPFSVVSGLSRTAEWYKQHLS